MSSKEVAILPRRLHHLLVSFGHRRSGIFGDIGVILKMLVGGNLARRKPLRIFVRHQRVVDAVLGRAQCFLKYFSFKSEIFVVPLRYSSKEYCYERSRTLSNR